MEDGNADDGKVAIPYLGGTRRVFPAEIKYVHALRAYSEIYFTDGSKMKVAKPLNWFLVLLAKYHRHCKVHKSHLIKLSEIIGTLHKECVEITIGEKILIPVSKGGKENLKKMGFSI